MAWFGVLVAAVLVLHFAPRVMLAILTKNQVKTRHLMGYEVWQELTAEIKARKLVAQIRREQAGKTRGQD